MRRFLSLLTLSLCLALFSGCGEPVTPETSGDTMVIADPGEVDATEKDTTTKTDDATPDTTDEENTDSKADETDTTKTDEDSTAEDTEDKEKLVEALQLNKEALQEAERKVKNLTTELEASRGGTVSEMRYAKFVDFYLANETLPEFPFPKCGNMTNFSGETWFAGFQKALETAKVSFATRNVLTTDLSGGCASAEGKMAFFLGADDGTVSEFHLLKYDFATDTVTEAFTVDGPYDVYPNELGKRFGPYLTLTGTKDGTVQEFFYYYGDNILKKK